MIQKPNKVIYLQTDSDDEITWCNDRINDSDKVYISAEYILEITGPTLAELGKKALFKLIEPLKTEKRCTK